MRRIVKLRIVNIVLLVIYLLMLLLDIIFDIFSVRNDVFWIMLFVLIFGIGRLCKFVIFKSDSSMWLGITFVSVAITYIIMIYYGVNIGNFYPLFLISPIIGSIFVGLIFKDVLQLKVVLYIAGIFVFLMLYSLNIIKLWQLIVCIIGVNIILTILISVIPSIWYKIGSKE